MTLSKLSKNCNPLVKVGDVFGNIRTLVKRQHDSIFPEAHHKSLQFTAYTFVKCKLSLHFKAGTHFRILHVRDLKVANNTFFDNPLNHGPGSMLYKVQLYLCRCVGQPIQMLLTAYKIPTDIQNMVMQFDSNYTILKLNPTNTRKDSLHMER